LVLDKRSVKILEGKTTLFVPRVSIESRIPPKTPAFYNLQAKFNRDLSVTIYRAMTKKFSGCVRFADSLAGVGARGVRVAVEAPEIDKVFINDLNSMAIRYAKASAKANKVYRKCTFSNLDVCRFLVDHSAPGERFEILDVDPFGSPSPYLDCSLRAVRDGGMISLTATDAPILCGIHPNVSFRKYNGYSLRTEYCHEIGIRLLLGALARSAMKLDMGIRPVFSHSTRHYIRTYVIASSGVKHAEESRKNLGYILHCFHCGNRKVSTMIKDRCDGCSKNFAYAGPLWIKEIHNDEFLSYLLSIGINDKSCEKIIRLSLDENKMPPSYYVIDKIADNLQMATPKMKVVINAIRDRGFGATKSAINPKGIKTDAPSSVIIDIVKHFST
jgi:tRNA (guanine26-N2/guanine27-N2)-dimethyltransferase